LHKFARFAGGIVEDAMRDPFVERLRHFYESSRAELFMYALSITREPQSAEDAVQTAFCAVLRQKRPPLELRPYLFRCIRNAAIDALHRSAREEAQAAPLFEREASPDPGLPALVEDLLAQLPADQRETIVLKTYAGLTLREIAEAREVSINTAASWYRRGLERLRELMEEVPNGPHRKTTE
jgi:RNA polymerase sigma-70 factor (ECF subfamily)